MLNSRPNNSIEDGKAYAFDGIVRRIRYESDDREFQVVFVENTQLGEVMVVLRNVAAAIGDELTIRGLGKKHKSGSMQVDSNFAARKLPDSEEGIIGYLTSGHVKGVGPVLAKKIVGFFGKNTIEVLNRYPHRLTEVPGVGVSKMEVVREAWTKHAQLREILIFLHSLGISPAYANRIYKEYGDKAVNIVQRNPYQLASDVHGIGFRIADKIGLRAGFSHADPRRVKAGLLYVMDQANAEGHTYFPFSRLLSTAAEMLEVDEVAVRAACIVLISEHRFVVEAPAPAEESALLLSPEKTGRTCSRSR